MTRSQAARLRRLARQCVASGSYGPLEAFCESFRYAAPSGLDKAPTVPISTDAAAGHNGPTVAEARKPLGWWERWMMGGADGW